VIRVLILVLLVSICSMLPALTFAQKVSTTSDAKYSFSEHKRYAWRECRLETRQNPDTNRVMNAKIVDSVNRLLTSRGFQEVQENPDLYVYYDGGGNINVGVGGADPLAISSRAPNDPTPTYGLGQGPTLAPSTWLIVKGQVVFHLVDANTKSLCGNPAIARLSVTLIKPCGIWTPRSLNWSQSPSKAFPQKQKSDHGTRHPIATPK